MSEESIGGYREGYDAGWNECAKLFKDNGLALGARDAALAAAEADCAAMREALEFYGSQKFFAVMPDDGKTRVVPICNKDGSFAHYLAFVNDDGEVARAALARPTGQALLDELVAARKVCEVAEWQENGGLWPENYADALAAYRAARKANT